MVATVRADSSQPGSQESQSSLLHSSRVLVSKASPAAFPRALAGNWIRSQAAKTPTGALIRHPSTTMPIAGNFEGVVSLLCAFTFFKITSGSNQHFAYTSVCLETYKLWKSIFSQITKFETTRGSFLSPVPV